MAAEHVHVSPTGTLTRCTFADLDADTEAEQLTAYLAAIGLPDEGELAFLRRAVLRAASRLDVPIATRPTCLYWLAEGDCDDYRFWLRPLRAGQPGPGAFVCGAHIVDFFGDAPEEHPREWLLHEWLPGA